MKVCCLPSMCCAKGVRCVCACVLLQPVVTVLRRTCLQLTAPKAGENVSLLVAVRVRPVLKSEQPKNRDAQPKKDILRVIDKRMVLVMDPEDPEDKDYLDQVQNRSKVGIEC